MSTRKTFIIGDPNNPAKRFYVDSSTNHVGMNVYPDNNYTLFVNKETHTESGSAKFSGDVLIDDANLNVGGSITVGSITDLESYVSDISSNLSNLSQDEIKSGESTKITLTTNNVEIKTNSTSRMVIDSNGNVGIGTTNPNEALDVSGNAVISGELTVNTVGKFIGSSSNTNQNQNIDNPGVYIGALNGLYGNLQIVSSANQAGWIDFAHEGSLSPYDAEGRIRYSPSVGMTFCINGRDNEKMRIDTAGDITASSSTLTIGSVSSAGTISGTTGTFSGAVTAAGVTSSADVSLTGTGSGITVDDGDLVLTSGDITASGALSIGSVSSSGAISGTTGTFSGTLNANGGINVNNNKFTVDNTNGNTAIAGTLDVTTSITSGADLTHTNSWSSYDSYALKVFSSNGVGDGTTLQDYTSEDSDVLYLARNGTQAQSYAAGVRLKVDRYEDSGTNSRTRLTFNLAHERYFSTYGGGPINVMSLLSSGNVGIGKTDPSVALDVEGDAAISGDLTVDTDTLYVDATDDKVGIGTDSPDSDFTFHVEGNSYINGEYTVISGGSLFDDPDYVDRTPLVLHCARGSGNNFRDQGKGCILKFSHTAGISNIINGTDDRYCAIRTVSESGFSEDIAMKFSVCNNNSTYVDALYIDPDGNVGIGTNNPSSALEVSGDLTVSTNATVSGTLDVTGDTIMEGNLTFAGGSPNGILFNSETTLSGNSTSDGATIYYEDDNLVIEKTDGNQSGTAYPDDGASGIHFRSRNVSGTTYTDMVLEGGKLGIGSSAPSSTLDVNGDAAIQGKSVVYNDNTITYESSYHSTIANTGNVVLKLQSGDTSTSYFAMGKHADYLNVGLEYWASSSDPSARYLNIRNGGANRVQISETGDMLVDTDTLYVDATNDRVGINKTPNEALDVTGNAAISGNIDVTGNAVVSGYLSVNNSTNSSYPLTIDGNIMLSFGDDDESTSVRSIVFGTQWWLMSTNDDFKFFTYNGKSDWTLVGRVQDDQNASTEMNFTGQHRTFIENTSHYDISSNKMSGLIVCADKNKYVKMSGGIAEGNRAITQNESLPLVSLSMKVYDKSCFGVISESEDPEERIEKYGAFCTPYDKEDGDTRVYINSLGEGAIWVSDICGNLESGDYITTSNIPGYGMKQESEFLANYTVAKITMDCDFDPKQKPVRKILKDASGENILNEYDQIQWEDTEEYEYAYKIRYVDVSGSILSKEDYDTKKENGESVHKVAYVGCTYHCG